MIRRLNGFEFENFGALILDIFPLFSINKEENHEEVSI
jgi:hypothetical protein